MIKKQATKVDGYVCDCYMCESDKWWLWEEENEEIWQ